MRVRKCKTCKAEFVPDRMGQVCCSPLCALAFAKSERQKEGRRAEIKARAEARKAKAVAREKTKRLADYIREAQTAFNAWVRARDAGRACISCGAMPAGGSCGGDFDAGHYRSRGAAPHLRFDERNCHAQCKRCNRYLAGNVVAYRAGLVERIGPEAVAALEMDHSQRKWGRAELVALRAEYIAKRKALETA